MSTESSKKSGATKRKLEFTDNDGQSDEVSLYDCTNQDSVIQVHVDPTAVEIHVFMLKGDKTNVEANPFLAPLDKAMKALSDHCVASRRKASPTTKKARIESISEQLEQIRKEMFPINPATATDEEKKTNKKKKNAAANGDSSDDDDDEDHFAGKDYYGQNDGVAFNTKPLILFSNMLQEAYEASLAKKLPGIYRFEYGHLEDVGIIQPKAFMSVGVWN